MEKPTEWLQENIMYFWVSHCDKMVFNDAILSLLYVHEDGYTNCQWMGNINMAWWWPCMHGTPWRGKKHMLLCLLWGFKRHLTLWDRLGKVYGIKIHVHVQPSVYISMYLPLGVLLMVLTRVWWSGLKDDMIHVTIHTWCIEKTITSVYMVRVAVVDVYMLTLSSRHI